MADVNSQFKISITKNLVLDKKLPGVYFTQLYILL